MTERGQEKNMTRIKANGINLNVEIYGIGEPLVLLMGLGADSRKWELHRKVYEKKFRCICIDNRGAGLSDAPYMNAYTTKMMANDTLAVLDELGIRHVHLHGVSMGGAIAQEIAIMRPDKVKTLILTSSFSRADVYFSRALEILRDSVGQMNGKVFNKLCQYMIYSPRYHNLNRELMEEMAEHDAKDSIQMEAYAYRAQCNACITHNTTKWLGKIQAPTLIAAGEKDLFVSNEITQELYQGIPNARLYLSRDSGHVHHWEKPDAFNAATLEFLEQHLTDADETGA